MLFTDQVRADLEREVLGTEFDVFFRTTLRRDAAFAEFDSPAALLASLHARTGPSEARNAALVELLRAYAAAARDRARIGALVLLALWPDVAGIVRGKTRQLTRKCGFSASDADDVEQALLLDLLTRLPRFDPARASLRTFVTRLADHYVATAIESREAPVRDWRRRRESLHDVVKDECGELAPRWMTLDREACRNRVRSEEGDERELHELRLDLAATVRTLPPELRRIAERLMTATPTEVARATGIPRGTVYELMQRIGCAFERAGISGYAPTLRRALR